MVSLSKGLGAPVGSVLVGEAEFVAKAREVRKLLGGGMRQVGVLAAAGLVAVRTMRTRLGEDHRRAKALAEGLLATGRASLPSGPVETNIVIVEVEGVDPAECSIRMRGDGVLALAAGARRMRFVTHLDVDDDDVVRAVESFARAVGA